MKITMPSWNKSKLPFTQFADLGDEVSEGVVSYFCGCVPPVTNTSDCMQCGEPWSQNEIGYTYITFKKIKGRWYYSIENKVE